MPNGGAKFSPGTITVTPACEQAFQRTGEQMPLFLVRHVSGDYGTVTPERARENDYAIQHNLRVLSEYTLADGTRIWVHTEGDRSTTEFMLPEEYGGETLY